MINIYVDFRETVECRRNFKSPFIWRVACLIYNGPCKIFNLCIGHLRLEIEGHLKKGDCPFEKDNLQRRKPWKVNNNNFYLGANLLVDTSGHQLRIADFGAAARMLSGFTIPGKKALPGLGQIQLVKSSPALGWIQVNSPAQPWGKSR